LPEAVLLGVPAVKVPEVELPAAPVGDEADEADPEAMAPRPGLPWPWSALPGELVPEPVLEAMLPEPVPDAIPEEVAEEEAEDEEDEVEFLAEQVRS
jgi:hypothetical protein